MKTDFEAYYADLRRKAVRQLETRRQECAAMDPAFAALQAKRSRVFFMPAQGAKLTLSTLRMEEEALLKRYGLPSPFITAPCARTRAMWGAPSRKSVPAD